REHPQEMPAGAALDQAATGLADLYRRNVYPSMNLSWNNYPSQMGHGGPDPGASKAQCFRCHAGEHHTADGQELSSKCALGRQLLTVGGVVLAGVTAKTLRFGGAGVGTAVAHLARV